MTSNTDWEKEWEESEVCKRIAGLESFAIAHGWTGFQGENVPDFIRTHISLAEKRGYSRGVAEEGINCYDHYEKARKEGQKKAVEFIKEKSDKSYSWHPDHPDCYVIPERLLEQARNL